MSSKGPKTDLCGTLLSVMKAVVCSPAWLKRLTAIANVTSRSLQSRRFNGEPVKIEQKKIGVIELTEVGAEVEEN